MLALALWLCACEGAAPEAGDAGVPGEQLEGDGDVDDGSGDGDGRPRDAGKPGTGGRDGGSPPWTSRMDGGGTGEDADGGDDNPSRPDGGSDAGWVDPWVPPTPPRTEIPECSGQSLSCSQRSTASCLQGSGCVVDGDCTGSSEFCSSQRSHGSCIDVQGCVWNSSSSRCSGVSWSCSSFSGSSSCIGQPGCSWRRFCSGTATRCESLSTFTCTDQPGCSLDCDPELGMCDETCVDLADDEFNCGACGFACGPHSDCRAGECNCAAPYSRCDGRCVDTRSDELNCGACGNFCGNGYTCQAGRCVDIDECRLGTCHDGRPCTNSQGSYQCGACPNAGYYESGDGCADRDECLTNHGGCDPVAPCVNDPGTHHCGDCPLGYTGSGATRCVDVDECLANNGGCDALTRCTNTIGGRSCSACPGGYTGSGATGCVDIDECQQNNGGCDPVSQCTNTPGGRTCGTCPSGYTGSGETKCLDVDECKVNNGGCDPKRECWNYTGGFACGACVTGYEVEGAFGCADIDECKTNNGGCDPVSKCTNTPGSRTCGPCPSGYTGDGLTGCYDINECWTDNGGCDPLTICTNTVGSRTCGACPTGYSGNGESGCVDIDECKTNNGGCDVLTACTNAPGTRSCSICPAGYVGNGAQVCQVGLLGLSASAGTLKAEASDTELELLLPREFTSVKLTATAVPGAVLTIQGKPAASGVASSAFTDADFPVLVNVQLSGRGSRSYRVSLHRTLSYQVVDVKKDGALAVDWLMGAEDDRFAVQAIYTDPLRKVFVYVRSGDQWQLEEVLPHTFDRYRRPLVLRGDTLVVPESGKVTIYTRSGTDWAQTAQLAPDVGEESFGLDVALENDVLVVSEPYVDQAVAGTTYEWVGAVHVYERNGTAWQRTATLRAPAPTRAGQYFGRYLAFDGEVIYATQDRADQPGCEVLRYVRDGSGWRMQETLPGTLFYYDSAVHAGGTDVVGVASGNYDQQDRLRMLQRTSAGWSAMTLEPAGAPGYFARSFALSAGRWLAASATQDESAGFGVDADPNSVGTTATGAIHLYELMGGSWKRQHFIKPPGPTYAFGNAVTLSERRMFVPEPNDSRVWIYRLAP